MAFSDESPQNISQKNSSVIFYEKLDKAECAKN
jgi:hypothetical protein